jgi:hypothetical protein
MFADDLCPATERLHSERQTVKVDRFRIADHTDTGHIYCYRTEGAACWLLVITPDFISDSRTGSLRPDVGSVRSRTSRWWQVVVTIVRHAKLHEPVQTFYS